MAIPAAEITTTDDLETKGYVRRVRHPIDRRAFHIEATEAGVSVQKEAVELLDACEARFLAVLSQGEADQLRELLRRLRAQ